MSYFNRVASRLTRWTCLGLGLGCFIWFSLGIYLSTGSFGVPFVGNIIVSFLIGLTIYDLLMAWHER